MSKQATSILAVGCAALLLEALLVSASAETLVPRTTERPSFDCAKAKMPIEFLICADADLARADTQLGQAYNQRARQLGDEDRRDLLQEQRQWAVFRRTECGLPARLTNVEEAVASKPCVLRLTQERVEALGGGVATKDKVTAGAVLAQAPARTTNAQAVPPDRTAQTTATGYEAALQALAGRLVTQLESAGQKSGTVLDFTDLQGQGTELGRFLAQELADQLVAVAKSMSIVDRANLQHLLRENKFSMEGLISPETSRKLGNMIGIDTVIFGTVTPIGQSVRLSVRAVAVESGKIVASQSVTIPALGQLGELHTRGVAANPSIERTEPAMPATNDLKNRIRADTIKLSISEIAVGSGHQGGGPEAFARITFSIENRSGVGVGVGIRRGYSFGPCSDGPGGAWKSSNAPDAGVSGLPGLDSRGVEWLTKQPNPASKMRWLPHGARAAGTILLWPQDCQPGMVAGLKTVPGSITAVLATSTDVVELPLAVDRVPIRIMATQ